MTCLFSPNVKKDRRSTGKEWMSLFILFLQPVLYDQDLWLLPLWMEIRRIFFGEEI